jgi:hypothetical protein
MGECQKSGGQKVRICKLRKDGKLEEITVHELKPIVYCNKCKAKANDPSYLCNPRALKSSK